MKDLICANCRYYRRFADDAIEGTCHRFPPQIDFTAVTPSGNFLAFWPQVSGEDDCGEFAPVLVPSPFAVIAGPPGGIGPG